MFNFIKKNTLASQILTRVFSIYLVIAFIITISHIFWQYQETKNIATKDIEEIYAMVAPVLSKSLWDYNTEQINENLKGLERLPFISSVFLTDINGEIYTSKGIIKSDNFNKKQDKFIVFSGPLIHYLSSNSQTKKKKQELGTLFIHGDSNDLYQRMKLGIWLLIINALIKTLALWFIFIAVGRIMISRPLHVLTKLAKNFNLNDTKPLKIDIHIDEKNELKALEKSFNDMTLRLHDAKNDLKDQKDILDFKAHYDGLTGLPNRELFIDRLTQAIKSANRSHCLIGVLFIDLDNFKDINDSLGHQVGDEVLKKVSNRLKHQVRETDTIARLGGDEFAVILNILHDTSTIINIVSNLINAMTSPLIINDHKLYSTLSVGVALFPDDGSIPNVLLKNADAAMYKAKSEGKNTYRFYTQEMTEKAFERIVMEANLRQALKDEDFVVYYQPQVDGSNNQVIGMEALIRWKHETMGLVSPAKFISLAEETGLIVPLDQWTMRTAMKQFVSWYAKGLKPGVLALNLAMKQLQQKDFIEILSSILKETRCKPEWIELEVTEGQIMNNPDKAIIILDQISDMGIELAIDDFGTGYSSLSYLKRLPIDKLKIDQSFIKNLPDDKDDSAIAQSVIALSQNLHLKVIAEGVENQAQKDFLVKQGCRNIQGYYYAKPMPEDEMKVYLEKEKTV